jgi:phosphate transport system substrate-binding protein
LTAGKSSSIKPLALDGTAPTAENILNGRYRLTNTYALVFKADRLNKLTREFIDFIFSKQGRQILTINGAIPLDRK